MRSSRRLRAVRDTSNDPSAGSDGRVASNDGRAPGNDGREVTADSAATDQLVAALADGDHRALGELFDLIGGRVFGTVRGVLRDPAQSEEVSQEVMLEVWRQAPRFDRQRGSATAWILTIAHRRAIDRVRSEQSARDRLQATHDRNRHRPFDEVAALVELREEHAQVSAALSQLTDLQREVVQLAYYQGYTYREVAEQLNTPLGTVKTRMRDALIRLRGALEVSQ